MAGRDKDIFAPNIASAFVVGVANGPNREFIDLQALAAS